MSNRCPLGPVQGAVCLPLVCVLGFARCSSRPRSFSLPRWCSAHSAPGIRSFTRMQPVSASPHAQHRRSAVPRAERLCSYSYEPMTETW